MLNEILHLRPITMPFGLGIVEPAVQEVALICLAVFLFSTLMIYVVSILGTTPSTFEDALKWSKEAGIDLAPGGKAAKADKKKEDKRKREKKKEEKKKPEGTPKATNPKKEKKKDKAVPAASSGTDDDFDGDEAEGMSPSPEVESVHKAEEVVESQGGVEEVAFDDLEDIPPEQAEESSVKELPVKKKERHVKGKEPPVKEPPAKEPSPPPKIEAEHELIVESEPLVFQAKASVAEASPPNDSAIDAATASYLDERKRNKKKKRPRKDGAEAVAAAAAISEDAVYIPEEHAEPAIESAAMPATAPIPQPIVEPVVAPVVTTWVPHKIPQPETEIATHAKTEDVRASRIEQMKKAEDPAPTTTATTTSTSTMTNVKKNFSKKNQTEESKPVGPLDAAGLVAAIKTTKLKDQDFKNLLDVLISRQTSETSEWKPANGGMDAAAILKRQLEEKETENKELLNLNRSLKEKLEATRKSHVQEKNRFAHMESQLQGYSKVQQQCDRQAQDLRNLRLQVQQEQENHMSEKAALHQKVAALEATSQNVAEQSSVLKQTQEKATQMQATAQKLQQELQLVQGELAKSVQKVNAAERFRQESESAAAATEKKRRDLERVLKEKESRAAADAADLRAKLDELARAVDAKDQNIQELNIKLEAVEQTRCLLEKKLEEALSCMPPTSERPAGDGQENPSPAVTVEDLQKAADDEDEFDPLDLFEAVPIGSAAVEAEKAAAAAAARTSESGGETEVSRVVADLEEIVKSKDAEISSLQNELTVLKLEVVSMREELLQMTSLPQTSSDARADTKPSPARSPVSSDKKSNSDSDEDYILIDKDEGVAAEAAAVAEAGRESSPVSLSRSRASPREEASSEDARLVPSLQNSLAEKETEIKKLKVELKDVMMELVEARETLEQRQRDLESLQRLSQTQQQDLDALRNITQRHQQQQQKGEPRLVREVVEVVKEVEILKEVPVAVPDPARAELETEISHYKGLLKETESMLERLQDVIPKRETDFRVFTEKVDKVAVECTRPEAKLRHRRGSSNDEAVGLVNSVISEVIGDAEFQADMISGVDIDDDDALDSRPSSAASVLSRSDPGSLNSRIQSPVPSLTNGAAGAAAAVPDAAAAAPAPSSRSFDDLYALESLGKKAWRDVVEEEEEELAVVEMAGRLKRVEFGFILDPDQTEVTCSAGVEEEEKRWRHKLIEKDEEVSTLRSKLSRAQVERQADIVKLNTRLEELQAERALPLEQNVPSPPSPSPSSPPPELIEYDQTGEELSIQEGELGTSV